MEVVENYQNKSKTVLIQLVTGDYGRSFDLLVIESGKITGEFVNLARDLAYNTLLRLVDDYAEDGIYLKNRKVKV